MYLYPKGRIGFIGMIEKHVPGRDCNGMQKLSRWSWEYMGDSVVNGTEKKIGAKAEREREEVRRESAKKEPGVSEQNTENRD